MRETNGAVGGAADGTEEADPAAKAERPPPANGDGVEIELKLLVDPADMPAFQAAPVLAEHARGPGARRRLRSVYYDTAGGRLRQAGFDLRVRRSGSRFIQTVKSDGIDDPLRRSEWEAPVAGLEPDLALALPLLPAKLGPKLANDPPVPVFATDIRRLVRNVTLPTGRVEVAFDIGQITAGDRSLPVSEIELELKDGSADAVYELGLRLIEQARARPSIRTKAARGFALADQVPPRAPKPYRPATAPDASLDDALIGILRAVLHHLFEAMPAAEDGRGPGGVHQTRVALRRLRSVFGLMRQVSDSPSLERFGDAARRIADGLGPARECDVFLAETLPTVAAALPRLDGHDALRNVTLAARADVYADVRNILADPETSRFLLELGAWIERRGWRADAIDAEALAAPAAVFARRTLALLHARVLKRGRRFRSMKPEARHVLRIAVKKLRYATDFLGPMLGDGKTFRRYYGALAELQDQLGRYNDMATTERLVAGFASHPAGRSQAAGAVVGWQAQGLASAEPQLREAWRRFRDCDPPWRDTG